MKQINRCLSVFIALVMVLGVFNVIPAEVFAADGVSYVERSWNYSTNQVDEETKMCSDATPISSLGDYQGVSLGDGWYYLDRTSTFSNRVNAFGNIKLILCDDNQLNLNEGLRVPAGSTLTVYAQEAGTGVLYAAGLKYTAGIGSDDEDDDEEDGGVIGEPEVFIPF